jgi:hypothetical protein
MGGRIWEGALYRREGRERRRPRDGADLLPWGTGEGIWILILGVELGDYVRAALRVISLVGVSQTSSQ